MIPEFYPIWAQTDVELPVSGNANKSRPVPALRDIGYDLGQKPAAEEFNWMWNNIFEWLVYFNEETILARPIGTDVDDALIVVDVRNNAQSWNISTGTPTVTENASNTAISVAYSLDDTVEVSTSMSPEVGTKEYVFEVKGISIPAVDGVDFFVEVNGSKAGVRVAGSGAVRLSNPATVIDAAYTFGNTSTVSLRLNSDGTVDVYLDGDIQLTGDVVARSPEDVVKFGYVIDGSGANTLSTEVSHNYAHTFLVSATGAYDSSNNPFDVGVGGLDSLDSRKLSKADEVHPGVVRVATQDEINEGSGDGVVTADKHATTTNFGLSRHATAAEAQSFSGSEVITSEGLSQAFSGANSNKATTGYQILPNGLIDQWIYIPTGGGAGLATASWDLPFPTEVLNIVVSAVAVSGSDRVDCQIVSYTNSQVTIRRYSTQQATDLDKPVFIRAIGH